MSLPTTHVVRLDDYFDSASAQVESLQTLDPDGVLSLGIANGASLRQSETYDELAVLSRLVNGNGTTILNEGRAGNGSLQSGSWATAEDGRYLLQAPHITYPHHESMVGVTGTEDEPSINVSGGVRIRGVTAGTVFHKPDVVQLSINADSSIQVTRTYGKEIEGKKGNFIVTRSFTTRATLQPFVQQDHLWHDIGFRIQSSTWNIWVDGTIVAQEEVKKRNVLDPGDPLTVGNNSDGTDPLSGEVSHIVYMGGTSTMRFMDTVNPSQGVWTSPTIDLGEPKTLHYVTNGGYVDRAHDAELTVVVSDTPEFKFTRSATFDLGERMAPPNRFPDRKLFVGQGRGLDYIRGRYTRYQVSLRQGDSNFSPQIQDVEVTFRSRN